MKRRGSSPSARVSRWRGAPITPKRLAQRGAVFHLEVSDKAFDVKSDPDGKLLSIDGHEGVLTVEEKDALKAFAEVYGPYLLAKSDDEFDMVVANLSAGQRQ
jgi:hypothetical protein